MLFFTSFTFAFWSAFFVLGLLVAAAVALGFKIGFKGDFSLRLSDEVAFFFKVPFFDVLFKGDRLFFFEVAELFLRSGTVFAVRATAFFFALIGFFTLFLPIFF